MLYFGLGILAGLSLHYLICSYGACLRNCECSQWKGLR